MLKCNANRHKLTAKKLQLPKMTDDISKPSVSWRYPPIRGPTNALNTALNQLLYVHRTTIVGDLFIIAAVRLG